MLPSKDSERIAALEKENTELRWDGALNDAELRIKTLEGENTALQKYVIELEGYRHETQPLVKTLRAALLRIKHQGDAHASGIANEALVECDGAAPVKPTAAPIRCTGQEFGDGSLERCICCLTIWSPEKESTPICKDPDALEA